MATRKVKLEELPEDRLTELIARVDATVRAEASAKKALDALSKQQEREVLHPAIMARLEAEYTLLRHCGRGKRRLFPRLKTAKRRTGSVERRLDPPSVAFPEGVEATLRRALELEHYRFVRWVPARAELDLEAMHADPEGARRALGVTFRQEEHLRVRVPAKRQSYVLDGRRILKQLRELKARLAQEA